MDRNVFFREMTLQISSSLELGVALHRSLGRLRKSISAVRRMLLALYEPSAGGIRFLVDATVSEAAPIDAILRLPPEAQGVVERMLGSGVPRTPILQDGGSTPVGKLVEAFLGEAEGSGNTMFLEVEGQKLAMLGFFLHEGEALTAHQCGLIESLQAPFSLAVANGLLHRENVLLQRQLAEDNQRLRRRLQELQHQDIEVIGHDAGLGRVMQLARQVAPLSTSVLLLGETGVGKDVLAQAIHRLSARSEAPLVKVNCGAIPEGLMDTELFGHERGAFTGAIQAHKGYFERADGGTLFLDEIGELSLSAQVRLLDVLQTNELERVGDHKRRKIDLRIIAATHRDLAQMVEEGRFRKDLWFRLNVFPIEIPPLRERPNDIPLLLQHFVTAHQRRLGFGAEIQIPADAIAWLSQRPWPGNVRELSNLIERALILGGGERLVLAPALAEEQLAHPPLDASVPSPPQPLDQTIADAIRKALCHADGKINGPGGAAEILDLHPNTLRSKMKKLGLSRATCE